MKKVKTKKEIIQYADQEFVHIIEEYNKEGQLVVSEEKSSQGELVERIEHQYNDQGLLDAERFVKNEEVYQTYHFTYDDVGHITLMTIDYASGGKEFHRYTRENGQEELKVVDQHEHVEKREVRTYNEQGQETSVAIYDEKGKLVSEEKTEFDEEGRVISKKWKNENDEGNHQYTFEIDEDGDHVINTIDAASQQIIEVETIVDKGEVVESIHEILGHYTILTQTDETNRTKTVEVEDDHEQLLESQHTTFDEGGNPLKEEIFNLNGLGKTMSGKSSQNMVKVYEYTFWEE